MARLQLDERREVLLRAAGTEGEGRALAGRPDDRGRRRHDGGGAAAAWRESRPDSGQVPVDRAAAVLRGRSKWRAVRRDPRGRGGGRFDRGADEGGGGGGPGG